MATTTNFGWDTPDDTDLVKDGAAAIRTLGSSIDTSFVDLKGGSTNQVLAKNSGTDLDFKWVADATGIPATIIDAKGDLIAGTAADTAGRLAVGTNGQVLTAASGETTGLQWTTLSAAAKSYTLLNAGGTALTGAATITVTGVTGDDLMILVTGASSVSASSAINIRFNTIATSKYGNMGVLALGGATYAVTNLTRVTNNVDGATVVAFAVLGSDAASTAAGYCRVFGAKSTGPKPYSYAGSASAGSGNGQNAYLASGVFTDTAAITSVSIISGTGDFDAGTIYVYEAQ